ncbi:polysaccharide export outer membrane protein [Novosphingobium chloroacetimidivorans]|uniref:Polysaccharide export outer membrane protein n=1 Tax=Novosphingobium chloroacetimidivorans TaxID=1428314 RepID=A0A7W7KDR5_9SPHN|nr:polysaccharide biosynthesis/export family protein [Novosphingobium chloroacetimidivorans]MBB4860972.1 polysaccharide export outer membrane protein [Novosphingobium chloroacetimidivorans]
MRFRVLIAAAALPLGANAPYQASSPTDVIGSMQPDDGYRLGANDEIEVTIFGASLQQNQVVRTRIKEDGTITLPFLGAVQARDRTARQLAEQITNELRSGGYFTRPSVNVDVTQYVSNVVTVFGLVGTPGIYPLDRPLTVGMAVARAGGGRPDGADYVVLSRRRDPIEHHIAFSDLTGEWSAATMVEAGDTLYVPVAPVVFVYGQVNGPGSFAVRSGMTVRQVLARAGGPTLAGTQNNITIYRAGQKLKKAELDSPVQPDDTIYIHERLL